jgi:hypothetical protein
VPRREEIKSAQQEANGQKAVFTMATTSGENKVNVLLRLRPLNKYELNRRSRTAVQVLDDRTVLVESNPEVQFACQKVSRSRV